MQTQQSVFWFTPVFAFCLSLIFSVVLAPTLGLVNYQQYDFWLLWLVTILVLALPFTILEIALAKRARSTPLHAFMQLTRDADTSTIWRWMSWGAVIFIPLVAGGMLAFSAQHLSLQSALPFSTSIVILILAVIAVMLSLIPRQILSIVSLLSAVAVVVFGLIAQQQAQWQWTTINFNEWAKVVVLSLVVGGFGMGLYWQNTLQAVKQQQTVMPVALPILFGQILGLSAFIFSSSIHTSAQTISLLIATLTLAAMLLQFVREQLLERQLSLVIQALIILLPVLVWAIPAITQPLYGLLVLLGLLLCLGYAIFAGWLMKISHLRKSINFNSEVMYNLWRIFIRIVAPLSIILAIIGWLILLLGA